MYNLNSFLRQTGLNWQRKCFVSKVKQFIMQPNNVIKPIFCLKLCSHQRENYKSRELIILNPRIIILKDYTFWLTVVPRKFSRNSYFYLRIEGRCKATSKPETKEAYNIVSKNLASFIDRELNSRQHAVYHIEGRSYGKRNQLEKRSAKLNKAKLPKSLYFYFLHFSRF